MDMGDPSMMVLIFLPYIVATVAAVALYFVIYMKAGFRGGILALCAMPLLVMLVQTGGLSLGAPVMTGLVRLVFVALDLVPLIVLAFVRWPVLGATDAEEVAL